MGEGWACLQDLATLGRYPSLTWCPHLSILAHGKVSLSPREKPQGPGSIREVLQLIGEGTWVFLPTPIWPQTMIPVLCSSLPGAPTALLSLHPSLGLSKAAESFSTGAKGYSVDYDGQGHCHQGMFIILSANKCK